MRSTVACSARKGGAQMQPGGGGWVHLVARTRYLEQEGVREEGECGCSFGCKLVVARTQDESGVAKSREIVAVSGCSVRVWGGGESLGGLSYSSSHGRWPHDVRVSAVQRPAAADA